MCSLFFRDGNGKIRVPHLRGAGGGMLPVFGGKFHLVADEIDQLLDADDLIAIAVGLSTHSFQQEVSEHAVAAAPLRVFPRGFVALAGREHHNAWPGARQFMKVSVDRFHLIWRRAGATYR